MPQEILDLIKAVNTYRLEQEALHDGITLKEFINMMNKAEEKQEKPRVKCNKAACKPSTQYVQDIGSYKVVSMDGTVTALDIAATDLVQVGKDTIKLVWPHTVTIFTTISKEESGSSYISQAEFVNLAEFCLS